MPRLERTIEEEMIRADRTRQIIKAIRHAGITGSLSAHTAMDWMWLERHTGKPVHLVIHHR